MENEISFCRLVGAISSLHFPLFFFLKIGTLFPWRQKKIRIFSNFWTAVSDAWSFMPIHALLLLRLTATVDSIVIFCSPDSFSDNVLHFYVRTFSLLPLFWLLPSRFLSPFYDICFKLHYLPPPYMIANQDIIKMIKLNFQFYYFFRKSINSISLLKSKQ